MLFVLFLVNFARQPKSIRQTVLRERINAANVKMECRQKVASNKSATQRIPARLYYQVQLGEADISVCLSSFRNLFGLFQRQWVNLKKSIDNNYKPGPLVHGNIGTHHRSDSSKATKATPSVVAFLEGVSVSHGEAYATRFIREITGMSIRKEEEGQVELPSSFTKRKLYAQYCYSRGYKVKASAKGSCGKTEGYEVRPIDDVLWPEGSVPLPVCSWKDFHVIWKVHLPKLSIRNPCEDTCGDCVKIRNSFKYLDKIGAIRAAASDAINLLDNVSGSGSENDESIQIGEYDFLNAHEYPEEVIIMQASKHAVHAQEQRQYATSRIKEAKESLSHPWEDRMFVDYCCLPFYFFSYSNTYPLG